MADFRLTVLYIIIWACGLFLRGIVAGPTKKENRNDYVIVQLFEWNWESVGHECTEFLGGAGYTHVQVSPAHEHVVIEGDPWWTDYQVASYNISSKRGTREQFVSMVKACHKAGVAIIADVVLNHMAGQEQGAGFAGSNFSHYEYPGIYGPQDFHYCNKPGRQIKNFDSREEVQFCELDFLADLATESEYVRSRLSEHINDLLSIGVDGLRIDAAKHIPANDLLNITSRFISNPYITQEVPHLDTEEIQPEEYASIGDLQEFRYYKALYTMFLGKDGQGIALLRNINARGWVPSSLANVFIANHDSERAQGERASIPVYSRFNLYNLANVFMLSFPYGVPTILSSYSFEDKDEGAPLEGNGVCGDNPLMGYGWICQHRWTLIVKMIKFRKTVGDAEVNHMVSGTINQIAYGRGSVAFVAINNEDSKWCDLFSTSLPPGVYRDIVSNPGQEFNVMSDGTFSAVIPPRQAIAFYKESR